MSNVIILMATYNGEKYLEEQIDSIIAQDYTDWVLIISDDQSTDNTLKIIQQYVNANPGKIQQYVSGQRFGNPQGHFMHLIAKFAGTLPYMMLSDQDDVWNKDKIRVTLSAMEEAEEKYNIPLLVHTDLRVVDENLRCINESFLRMAALDRVIASLNHLLIQNVVTGCTLMMNDKLQQLVQRPMSTENIIMHDWWLALIAAAFGKIVFVDQATIDYRQHEKNTLGAKNVRSIKYVLSKIKNGSDSRNTIRKSMCQALVFSKNFSDILPEEFFKMTNCFGLSASYSKLKRLYIVCKYNIWKTSFSKFVGIIGEIIMI